MSRWVSLSVPAENGRRYLAVTLPDTAGVYVLYHDRQVFFVGQSFNMRQQILQHEKHGWLKSEARIKFRAGVRFGEWFMAEARLVRRLKPVQHMRLRS